MHLCKGNQHTRPKSRRAPLFNLFDAASELGVDYGTLLKRMRGFQRQSGAPEPLRLPGNEKRPVYRLEELRTYLKTTGDLPA